MKRFFTVLLAFLLLGMNCRAEQGTPSFHMITQEEAMEMMGRDDGHVVVDVRRQDEYDSGHIPGAVLIPNEEIGAQRPQELQDPDQIILIYCRSGNRSRQAAAKLAGMGYTRLYEFGGIITWPGRIVTSEEEAAADPLPGQTITAMAVEPYMERYALYASYARIRDYDRDTYMLTVELTAPEIFRQDDAESLSPGDGIYTGGQEVAVTSVMKEEGMIVLNAGPDGNGEDALYLYQDREGNYRPEVRDDYVWMEMAVLELPVTERLLFLDMIVPETGEPLDKPTVHTAEGFLRILAEERDDPAAGPGFAADNVLVVFDGNGDLAVIRRFYVPWQ